MAGRGWQFLYAQYAPAAPRVQAQPQRGWSSGASSSPSSTDIDDEMRRNEEFSQMMQSQSDQQLISDQMVANENAVAAQQAQDQIMQNAINNMNAPIPQQ